MVNNFSSVKAVIFDIDGVLFLSVDCHRKAWQETLAGIEINLLPYASIAGMRTDDAMRKILVENGRNIHADDLQKLVDQKRRRSLECLTEKGEIAAGSRELITQLREKYRLALVSSASIQIMDLFLLKSGYADAFEFCLDGSSVKEAKPSPEIYLQAIGKLGLPPGECVVIEDAANGVQAAVMAGMKVIAVTGTDDPQKLIDAGAMSVVTDLKEVEALFL